VSPVCFLLPLRPRSRVPPEAASTRSGGPWRRTEVHYLLAIESAGTRWRVFSAEYGPSRFLHMSFEAGTERLSMTRSKTTRSRRAQWPRQPGFRPAIALAGFTVMTWTTTVWANDPAQRTPTLAPLLVQSEPAPPPTASRPANPPLAEQDFFRLRRPPSQPREAPRDHGSRDSAPDEDGPGCPANQRPLDLLV
jgi:hypothetical protein